jgi:hypothetical protein
MGVKILGVDTPLDSQAEVPFEGDVELPGQFGKGGFTVNPRITAPATGSPPGTSLSTVPKGAYVNPATGQLELLPGGASSGFNPLNFLNALPLPPIARGAIAGAGVMAPTPTANDAAPTNMWNQRPSGVGGQPGPQVTNPPAAYPQDYPASRLLDRPAGYPQDYPVSRLLDSPAAAAAAPAARGGRATPAAAGPAAAAQQPNLGNYGASPFTTLDYRPNSGPNERNRGSPVATALDLSRLFGGGAPAAAPVTAPVYNQPSKQLIERSKAPGTMGPLQKGSVWPREMGPKKRPKDSASSQGG